MNCDLIAPWYRWFEYIGFGRELERRRFAYLTSVADASRILVLGGGDGRFLKRLAAQNPQARIDYVDLSARMLDLARGRASAGHVVFHRADARSIPLAADEYDLIVTHFFLDCFNRADAESLVRRLAGATNRNARWLISEFRQPARGWRSAWARVWLGALYRFFRVVTGLQTNELVDHHPLLANSGYRLDRFETSFFGLLSSELWTRVRQ